MSRIMVLLIRVRVCVLPKKNYSSILCLTKRVYSSKCTTTTIMGYLLYGCPKRIPSTFHWVLVFTKRMHGTVFTQKQTTRTRTHSLTDKRQRPKKGTLRNDTSLDPRVCVRTCVRVGSRNRLFCNRLVVFAALSGC